MKVLANGVGLILLAGAASFAHAAASPHTLDTVHSGSGQHGSVSHTAPQGYLGIDVRSVNEDEVAVLHLKDSKGAEIVSVDHDGPAGKIGLRERDVVLQMNGVAIDDEEQIRRMLHECGPGHAVALVVMRDGVSISMTTAMADREAIERQAWAQHVNTPPSPQAPSSALPSGDAYSGAASAGTGPAPSTKYSKSFLGTLLMSPSYTGLMLETMTPQLSQFFGVSAGGGLLVHTVADNSPAAMAGLRAGDVVIRANALRTGSMSAWAKAVREAKGRPVAVTIVRDKQEKTLTLTPDAKRRGSLYVPALPEEGELVRLACLCEL